MNLVAALRRFFADHKKSLGGLRYLVACSGGPDSVALARGLKEAEASLAGQFVIGHVNHGLRGAASDADARFVAELGRRLKWRVLSVRCRPPAAGNLEEGLRDLRYEALERLARQSKCAAILTAHSRDDQIETILMNLLRGTGPDGLGGMRPVRAIPGSRIRVGRPLLSVPRGEIVRYLRAGGYPFRMDRTNKDQTFLRNWLRGTIVPLFEKRSPGFGARLEQLAEMARSEAEFWDDFLAGLEANLLTRKGSGRLLDMQGLLSYPAAVQRRFLRRIIGRDLLTFDAVERLRRWMTGPATNGRLFQMRQGWTAERLSKSQGSPSATLFWLRQTIVRNKRK